MLNIFLLSTNKYLTRKKILTLNKFKIHKKTLTQNIIFYFHFIYLQYENTCICVLEDTKHPTFILIQLAIWGKSMHIKISSKLVFQIKLFIIYKCKTDFLFLQLKSRTGIAVFAIIIHFQKYSWFKNVMKINHVI